MSNLLRSVLLAAIFFMPQLAMFAATAPPDPPTNFRSSGGSGEVSLSWNASPGATSYNLKRSTVSGGPYTLIAPGINPFDIGPSGTSHIIASYVDLAVNNGITYYYIVSAVNLSGEGANTGEVSSTPTAPSTTQALVSLATVPPVIDGNPNDSIWATTPSYPFRNVYLQVPASPADFSGTFQLAWDSANLYALYRINDTVKINDSINPWDDDSAVLYLDTINSRNTAYGPQDFEYVFGWNDTVVWEMHNHLAGVVYAQTNTPTGYYVEVRIPWSTVGYTPTPLDVIGVDTAIEDDDDGGPRNAQLAWMDQNNNAWHDPSVFGTGLLILGPTITVTSLADDGKTGTLRAAINAANANPGSTITFQSGLTGPIKLTSALPAVTAGVTIHGPGAPIIAIDGAGKYRPFYINAPGVAVTISGLTIENGSDLADGAGGGGIRVMAGNFTLTSCTVSGNTAVSEGGGVSNTGNSTFTGCKLSGNSASGHGGGLWNSGTTTLTDCTLSGNSVGNNSGDAGGGVYNNGTATLTNSTLSGNSVGTGGVQGGGGAVFDDDAGGESPLTLMNCTLSANIGGTGGGIQNSSFHGAPSPITLTNCILYDDSGGEIYGSNVSAAYCDLQGGYAGIGNINADPLLGPLANNGGPTQTMALGSGSPCFGAGTPASAPITDQCGNSRPNPPSIGAYDGTLIPISDLRVTAVHSPATAITGQSIIVSYTVQNEGAVATNTSWTDTLSLSTTPDLAGVVATLGTVSNTNVLMAGQSYIQTPKFTVPSSASGNLYVVVQTNSGHTLSGITRIGASLNPVSVTSAGHLWLSFNVPYVSRANQPIVGYFSYGNDGQGSIPAPLLVLSIHDGTPVIRMSQNDPWTTNPIQILGIGPDPANPGVIGPGQSKTVPFYFNPQFSTYYHFTLSSVDVSGTSSNSAIANPKPMPQLDPHGQRLTSKDTSSTPINWAAIEAQVKPSDMDPQAWSIIWNNFKTQLGATWRDYANALIADGVYLFPLFIAENQVTSIDHTQNTDTAVTQDAKNLFSFELDKASGRMCPQSVLAAATDAVGAEPGFPLILSRVAPVSIDQRYHIGPLGRGWANSFEYSLVTIDGTHMNLKGPGGVERLFDNIDGNGWHGQAGDYGILVHNTDGSWMVTEKGKSTMTFSATGVLTAIADAHGNTITPVYSNNKLTEIDHSNGDKISITYDPNGRITTVIDPFGRITTYGYDPTGQLLTSVTAPDGRITSYAYAAPTGAAADYALSTITYPNSTHLYYQYDSEGRLTGHHLDGGAQQVTYSFTGVGTVQITDAAGKISSVDFGIHGGPLNVTDATSRGTGMLYDDRNNLTNITTPDGNISAIQFDSRSNPNAVTDALGKTTQFGADAMFDSLSWMKDANGSLTSYALNNFGDNTGITYPSGTNDQFGYDVFGDLTGIKNRAGSQIAYTRDSHGRVSTKTYQSGQTITYSYDGHGNLTSAVDTATGTITLSYNAKDYLTKITYPGGHWLGFAYDGAGRRTQRTSDSGFTLSYGYDSLGRLSQVTDGAGNAYVSYSYNALGQISQEAKGNGSYTTYEYDTAGRVSDIINYGKTGVVQSRFDYTFDTNGNRKSVSTLSGTTNYSYDKTGQLTGISLPASISLPGGRTITYQYDALGNRSSVVDNGVTTAYTTNALNQYTQVGSAAYAYNANGDVISKTGGGIQTAYGYDADNRLISVTTPTDTWTYTYDALGDRSTITHNGVTSVEVTDPTGLGDLSAEYTSGGAVIAQYVNGGGLIGRIAGDGSAGYYAFDGVGSTSEITDANGAIVNSYQYMPFGELVSQNETLVNPFKFVGELGVQQNDPYTTCMRHRNYDSVQGRFLQPDPTGLSGGDVSLYRYAGNDPMAYVDPSGTSLLDILKIVYLFYALIYPYIGNNINNIDEIQDKTPDTEWISKRDISAEEAFSKQIRPIEAPGVNLAESGQVVEGAEASGLPGVVGFAVIAVALYNLGEAYGWWSRGSHAHDGLDSNIAKEFAAIVAQAVGGPNGGGNTIGSADPNAIQGPPGFGAQHAIVGAQPMTYTIYFENDPKATAPARTVTVTDTLDATLNPTSVSLGEVTIGKQSVTGLTGLASGATTVALNDSPYKLSIVETTAGGTLQWTLTCFDPTGADLPVTAGFLPPDDSTGRGEGHITFTVNPSASIGIGTTIPNAAAVVFDNNPAIATNIYTNLIGAARADQLIRLPLDTSYSGGGVYVIPPAIPASQLRTQSVNTGQTAVYNLALANSGTASGNYLVTGPAGSNGWTITYYDAPTGGNNITSAVAGSGWPVSLDPGSVQQYRVEITSSATVAIGSAYQVLVTAESTANSSVSDTVETVTTALAPIISNPVIDFNGDGKADLILQNTMSNRVAFWYMNNAALSGGQYVSLTPSPGWNVVSEGDFNGDGKPDLVLQNSTNNRIALWYMNGATLMGGAYVALMPATGWKVVGSADLNGDGNPDLVLQNTASNKVAFWYMNGPAVTSGAYASVTPAGWRVAGTGDFNGDGKTDLVLQNTANNKVAVWYMNGATLLSGQYFATTPPANWLVAGVGDFTGDGKPDLVLQNAASNKVALWYMNGVSVTGGAYTSTTPGTGWHVMGPR